MKYLILTLFIIIASSCKQNTDVEDSCTDFNEKPIGSTTNSVRIIGIMPFPGDGDYEKVVIKDFDNPNEMNYSDYGVIHKEKDYNAKVFNGLIPSELDLIQCGYVWELGTPNIGEQMPIDLLDNTKDSLQLFDQNGTIIQTVKFDNAQKGEWIFF